MGVTTNTTLSIVGVWIMYLIILILLFELDQRNIARIPGYVYPLYVFFGIIGCSVITTLILGANLTSGAAWKSSSGRTIAGLAEHVGVFVDPKIIEPCEHGIETDARAHLLSPKLAENQTLMVKQKIIRKRFDDLVADTRKRMTESYESLIRACPRKYAEVVDKKAKTLRGDDKLMYLYSVCDAFRRNMLHVATTSDAADSYSKLADEVQIDPDIMKMYVYWLIYKYGCLFNEETGAITLNDKGLMELRKILFV